MLGRAPVAGRLGDMEQILERDGGFSLLRASRLEALVPLLDRLLAETWPDNPLMPQTVVAAHPGMKQWLARELARHVGAGRVVANLDVQLPSAWLDGLSAALLGERAVALPGYRRGHLRWTLHAMLGEPERHGVSDPQVLAYLGPAKSADERALRRFQLADRLARVFTQYLVYRAEWLRAWEAGKWPYATVNLEDARLRALETQCLAPLWKAVAASLGEHRGGLVGALVEALDARPDGLAPLHVFGVSHLPPAELEVLRRYACLAPVFLYVPDPCREYWGGLHAARARGEWRVPDAEAWGSFRDDEDRRLGDPDALDWNDQGHPLLARWGRMGQHFFAALADGEVREDIRHWKDEAEAGAGNRLQRLQESIRRLEPALMREDPAAEHAAGDSSLRIHACHTRQRELEVLRDALLDAIEKDGVRPGDIVVMAPDIQAYLPLIPAVFGEAGSGRGPLPYHLADVPVVRSHRLFAAFDTLLGMGGSRVTAPEVVDLLGTPEVRRALSLGDDDADTLVEWLRLSRVAWALDGGHKSALSLPARPEYSFAWGMDRMLAGYLMGDGQAEQSVVALADGTELLPLAGIEGPSAAALGSLDRLLCELQAWRDLAGRELPASAWAATLGARVEAVLRVDPMDADARAALSVVRRAIAQLASEPARNGEDPLLRMAVVRELLQDALAAAPERQRFLMGGITFCGMVPQRAIPFDVVCVLGLDEGAFPRRTSDGGIDLMARIRRVGDRDVPSDDRYLFLETVMSARKRLHLSYIGQGARDGKARNPAAPLAELLAELDRQAALVPDDAGQARPWLVRHPLQPFDGRYFDGGHPALFSYSEAFAGMQGEGRERLSGLRERGLPGAEPLPDPLPLRALEGYFKDPARALLADHLQVSLDALDDDARLPEDEPMGGISAIHTVARRVFLEDVLPRRCADPDWKWSGQPPAWVAHGGVLPLGADGEGAWRAEAEAVRALCAVADASGHFDARGAGGGQAVRLDVALAAAGEDAVDGNGPLRVVGTVRNVFPLRGSEAGVQVVFAFPKAADEKTRLRKPEDLDFKYRVPAFLQWALLRLQRAGGGAPAPVRLTMLAGGEPDLAMQANAWDERYCQAGAAERAAMEGELRRRVRALAGLWQAGREGVSRFYPKAGWAVVQAMRKQAGSMADPETFAAVAKAAAGSWSSEFNASSGERDYAPGFARLLEGDLVFGDPESDPDAAALQALAGGARRVNELIMLDGRAADAPETGAADHAEDVE